MSSRRKTSGRDFTGGALSYLYQKRGSTRDPVFDEKITDLVRAWGGGANPELIEELIITALKLAHEGHVAADLKLINRAVKEFREAARIFNPYVRQRKVVVFGSARTAPDHPECLAAEAFAKKVVEEGFMVITGGGDGIMGAAQRGAGRDQSFGLNIRLPFEQGANDTIEGDRKLITFNYFFTRKTTFLKEAEAVALFPGGFGTMDEMFEVLTLIQTGKATVLPIIMIDTPGGTYWKSFIDFIKKHLLERGLISPDDLSLFKLTECIDEAVQEVKNFYKNFHSYRNVGDQIVIRMHKALDDEKMKLINKKYRALLKEGDFVQGSPLAQELGEPELFALPRLIFHANRKHFGLLRELIDEVNR